MILSIYSRIDPITTMKPKETVFKTEADALKYQGNLEEMFPRYHMHNDVNIRTL